MTEPSRLGRYAITREIARSNDIVYEATDTLIGRRVALKELALPPSLTGQSRRDRIERFYREARAAGSLSHPNIVTIYEVGDDQGRHFIAMEYLEGRTLRSHLDLTGPLPLAETRAILLQVLDALAYAHPRGVVHRDIKPDNLHLLPDGTVKLTDFGIARIMEEPSLTLADQVFGTPSYMSPEQVTGKPVDERTDLYSAGVMAYEMLAGRKPFAGENLVALTYQILNVDPVPIPGAPDGIDVWLRKSMAREPEHRFQSARSMADALRDLDTAGRQVTLAPFRGTYPPGSLPAADPRVASMAASDEPWRAASETGTGVSGTPTLPPRSRPRRAFRLSRGAAQFLLALAGGALLGLLLIAGVMGVRSTYQNYTEEIRDRASMSLYLQGVRAYNAKRLPEAIRSFETVHRRTKGSELSAKAALGLSQSYLLLGDAELGRDLQRALHFYRAARQARPDRPEALNRMGDVLERLGHFDEAIDAWRQAETMDGFGPHGMEARRRQSTAWYNRGVAEYNAGNHDPARQYWNNAIRADPEGPAGQLAREKLQLMQADPTER